MRRHTRIAVLVSVAVGSLLVIGPAARAQKVETPRALAAGESAYSTTGALPGRHAESVLTDPVGAMAAPTPGTGWILHSGSGERDMCNEADATEGLRLMCVGW